MIEALNDTIAAICTPAGAGAVAVIRLAGPDAIEIASKMFRPVSAELSKMKGYAAAYGTFVRLGERVDDGIALVFRAPRSYTGEDAVELSCHGGASAEDVLSLAVECGARPAHAGEFTKRAYLNGKMSLFEAEAVADIVSSVSREGARAAVAASVTRLGAELSELRAELTALLSHLQALIDFPEEGVEPAGDVHAVLLSAVERIERLVSNGEKYLHAVRGVPTAIVGSPNVGKSTLLNLLSGTDRAIVTPIPGTTRDVLEQSVSLGGTTLILKDTAGIRKTDDPVEKLGVARARAELERASLVLAVFDGARALEDDDRALAAELANRTAVAVINKTDLPQVVDESELKKLFKNTVSVSALDPASTDALSIAVKNALGGDVDCDAPLVANERQRACAVAAAECIRRALDAPEEDMAAFEVERALDAMAELDGTRISDDVIDGIFSRFCVGK